MPSEPHIDALVSSLEFLANIKPEMTMNDVLPVIDAVLAEHNTFRGKLTRVDDLLVLARKAQAA